MKKIILLILTTIVVFGFTKSKIGGSTEECLIGTWVSDEDSKVTRTFNSNGKSFETYEGESSDEYTYTILREQSPNGITHETLKLISVSDPDDIYLYDINSISDTNLVLEYLVSNKLLFFTKQ